MALTKYDALSTGKVVVCDNIELVCVVDDWNVRFDRDCLLGFDKGLNSLASQAFGAKNYLLLGPYVQMGCLIATVPLGAIGWWFAGGLLGFFGVTPASIALVQQYSHLSVFWLWPRIMY
ncbi:unnamed protein product [Aphanomyces euteiches]